MRSAGLVLLLLLVGGTAPSSAEEDLLDLVPERLRASVRAALGSPQGADLRSGFRRLEPGERASWAFLVAHTPPAERKRLTGAEIADHVRTALRARSEQPFAKDLPEDLFRHWVLPFLSDGHVSSPRRPELYEKLKARLEKRRADTAEKSALEVSRYCSEEMPEGALRRRLFVHAARAVGLPARVVRTPWWTFRPGNAAWCEVHVGPGKRGEGPWRPLLPGAKLRRLGKFPLEKDLGRAALVLAETVGPDPSEGVLTHREGLTVVNLTSRYAETSRTTVSVVDGRGRPVPEAPIALHIYNDEKNQHHLRHALVAKTGPDGRFVFDLGPGDYVVQAAGPSGIGWSVARSRPGEATSCRIQLGDPQPLPNSTTYRPGNTALQVVFASGGGNEACVLAPLREVPWVPFGFVGIGGPKVEMRHGRFLLQAARRRGPEEVLLSLQVVEVKKGTLTTVRVPASFPPRADGEGGLWVLRHPR